MLVRMTVSMIFEVTFEKQKINYVHKFFLHCNFFFFFYKIVISSFNVILSNACYSCYQANIASDVLPLIYFQVWSITRVKGACQIRASASVFPQDRRRNPFRCLLPCQCHHSSSQICETFYGNLIKISSDTCLTSAPASALSLLSWWNYGIVKGVGEDQTTVQWL